MKRYLKERAKMKKIISILLSILILLPTVCSAKDITIQNNMNVYADSIPNPIIDFVSTKLPLFLDTIKENPSMYKIDERVIDFLYVGNGFNSFEYKYNTLENNNIYFFPLLFNEEIHAILTIGYDGQKIIGATLSSSLSEKHNKIHTSNVTNKPYIIIAIKDALIIKSEDYTENLQSIMLIKH
jgi:hypothetical protein